ncbi:MAG: S-layer homology domain-containing protein [Fimbriimonadaceae bacterium]|nr:S-layer homology domain-containing protein [Fimbriimonadaceae bacterium]QYK56309.1 MAG: S-layer homology domain-containing protein [Fimbriimonadaceae bacterium]
MNRTLKFALGAVLALMAVPAFAQVGGVNPKDPNAPQFQDVFPSNHWAYTAVLELRRAGILVGYPVGNQRLYRGNRPMSRYEFAAAMWAAYKELMGLWEGHERRIKALEDMGPDSDLRRAVEELRADVDRMKGWESAIQTLQRGMEEVRGELNQLGMKVDQMGRDLDDIKARVRRLEEVKPAVEIHGTVDFLVLASHSTDDNFGLTPDNRLLGVGRNSRAGAPVGLTTDLDVLHEIAIDLKGTNEEGPKWDATIVAGNMLGDQALVNQNFLGSGTPFNAGSGDVYIQRAAVTFDSALVGQGFGATVGRFGYQVGPYLFKRNDFTETYFVNDRWDNGNYTMDGAVLSFNFGPAALKVFGGVNSNIKSTNGVEINPIPFGVGQIDRTLGVQLTFPVGEMGGVNLAYLFHDSDQNTPTLGGPANRVNTFGGDVNLKFDNLEFFGSFAQTNISYNTDNRIDEDNIAWDVRAMYKGPNFGVGGGYREVERNFAAAGDWGRIGNVWNPTNIKGFNAHVYFMPSEQFKIYGKGEFLEPKDTAAGLFANMDDMNAFTVGLDYKIADNWGAMFSYEDVRFNPVAGNDVKERWYTVGFNYGLGANTNIRFTYQFSDLDFGGAAGAGLDPAGQNIYKGGLFGTQLTVRF